LHSWVTSHSYLKALVADGAVRCGLDDQAVEAVDPQHQAEARKLIAAVDAAKAKRAAARSSPEMQEEGANDLSRTPPAPTAGASCAAG
jgi:sRNA-binding protein